MKKRLFSIFVVLCMVVTMIPAMSITATAHAGGPDENWYSSHTQGPYLIEDQADLLAFAKQVNESETTFKDETVKLTKNIDLSALTWTPIGKIFEGTFDGGGHTISSLTIDTKQKYSGFSKE